MNTADPVRQILTRHAHSGDGGYAAAQELGAWLQKQNDGQKDAARQTLLEMVDTQQKGAWGIALEALVQEANPVTARSLVAMLGRPPNDYFFKYQIALALARLGSESALALIESVIREGLSKGRAEVAPLIANLARIDPQASVGFGAEFFAQFLRSGDNGVGIRGYVSAFARIYLSFSPGSIGDLVRLTVRKNPLAGSLLKSEILNQLKQPWFSNVPPEVLRDLSH